MGDKSNPQSRPTPLGIYDKPKHGGITVIEVTAIVLSGLWLLAAAAYSIARDTQAATDANEGTQFLVTMLAVFMPVAMIWVAATAARSSRVMREESQRLQAAIDAIRQAYIAEAQGRGLTSEPSVARKLDEIAAATRKTETALAMFQSQRDSNDQARVVSPTTPPAPAEDQPTLALGTTAEDIAPQLVNQDFIRALNFPETTEDEDGFAALRKAMKDRETAQLIQAAQDILTLLSQDGIYMDDLRPDRARPEIWRQFASGARGRAVASLGGVRDRSSLALTVGRMKQDPIFRDAAHHFLRRFDRAISTFAETASDAEISALSDTRTARAFMLLGRVAGTFD